MSPTSNIPPIDPTNPTALALAITQLQGEQTVLSQAVSTNVQNLTSTLHSVQAELRHMGEQLADVARLQQQQVSHSEGLERAFKAIEKLATSFETWKDRHETENRTVSDAVTEFRGRLRGVWMAGGAVAFLGGALVTFGGFWVQRELAGVDAQFAEAKAERSRIETQRSAALAQESARMQAQIDGVRSDLETVKATRGAR